MDRIRRQLVEIVYCTYHKLLLLSMNSKEMRKLSHDYDRFDVDNGVVIRVCRVDRM